ncbi:hypothetical protein [Streptomyces sp. CC224B]|uniref:hypothetical protein n=1 Tax=Streptomyces sp. CC224B TaxID=3044571 RepID=UPI0024A9C9EF|nr:hypothetical protein [Streptomyces sp. CC224B]
MLWPAASTPGRGTGQVAVAARPGGGAERVPAALPATAVSTTDGATCLTLDRGPIPLPDSLARILTDLV